MKSAVLVSIVLVTVFVAAFARQGQQIAVTGQIELSNNADFSNAVVWLNPVGGQPSAPVSSRRQSATLLQKNKTFSPHLLIVQVGTAVEFPNKDPFFHNVFSLFEGKRFDLGLYEAGSTRNVSFDRPGISYIFCNIHAEMSAVVIALQTPYYGISNAKGELLLPQVAPGRYVMHMWYETALPAALSSMTREITVTPESSTLGVLQVPAGPPINAHKNKYGMDYEPPAPDSPGYVHP